MIFQAVFQNRDEFVLWMVEHAAWLQKEIARIEAGGACAPWLSKEEDLQRLRDALIEVEEALQGAGEPLS